MNLATGLLIASICILVVLLLYKKGPKYFKFSRWNTKKVKCESCLEGYNVHKEHHNPVEAAKLIAEINRRNLILIEHLKKKYIVDANPVWNPDKSGVIDVIPMAEMFGERHVGATSEFLQERVTQLIENYDSNNITEISPLNSQGNTSYTENKRKLVLCLRHKKPNASGKYELHDPNTMMFVVIHELAHMMNNGFGHTDGPRGFWALFKLLLQNATEAGVYKPIDYFAYPIVYCGLLLSYNPMFDPRL
jgi:hypothetical protein